MLDDTDWRPFDVGYTSNKADYPHQHVYIELKYPDGRTLVIRHIDIPPDMNVWGLFWRPARKPQT